MYLVNIQRYWSDECQTIGVMTMFDNELNPIFAAISLERGWLDNKPNVSSIPTGNYKCVLEYSPKFGKELWELKEVPNRSECKFHVSNYWSQLEGCIALGDTAENVGQDFRLDVTNSGPTMETFHRLLRDQKEIKVVIQ